MQDGMLDFVRSTMHVNVLAERLMTGLGLAELVIGFLCCLLAVGIAKAVYRRFFANHPERYERFLPYLGFRMVLPLSAQLLVQAAAVVWSGTIGGPATILWSLGAMLFWLAVIRVFLAVVRQALPSGKFERNTEHFVSFVCWVGFVTWAVQADDVVLGWMESVAFKVGKSQLNLLMVLTALWWVSIIIIGTLWVSRVVEKRLMHISEIDLSLRIVFNKLIRSIMLIAAVLVALPVVGIDLTVLSVFGGALGVGLGFGLQKIASNYISGFIILLDRSIRIGDRLVVDNKAGYVTKITARYVVLKGLDGSEALVPNDTLIANTVINQSYTDKAIWISLPVQVDYGTDLDHVLEILKEAAVHPRLMPDIEPAPFVTGFAESGINLEVGVWVSDPENGMLALRSDINLAIWRKFKQHGISIPFPQREVRVVQEAPTAG